MRKESNTFIKLLLSSAIKTETAKTIISKNRGGN